MSSSSLRLGVVGLGKLGLPLASLLAHHYKVWGYDTNQEMVLSILRSEFKTWEPDCDYQKLQFTKDTTDFVANIDMAFLCVNTPSNLDGTMDLSQVESAAKSLAQANKAIGASKLPVVVSSTVMPGTCRQLNESFPELLFISNPVWIALGSVIKDLQSPPNLVIGCDCDKHSGLPCPHNRLLGVWARILGGKGLWNTTITDTKTAEFIKLAHNAWCCIKMSWLGNLGDHTKDLGINIADLSYFMSHGGERSGKFWQYGPSFGGPCFPRDLGFWNESTWEPMGLVASQLNYDRLVLIIDQIPEGATVFVLGSSYKYGVPITEGSLGLKLADKLRPKCDVRVHNGVDESTQIPDYYVVCHKELANQIPPNTRAKIINLWGVPV